ncbi:hypothetical protein RFI_19805, partial [Reticulomyxa filosa]
FFFFFFWGHCQPEALQNSEGEKTEPHNNSLQNSIRELPWNQLIRTTVSSSHSQPSDTLTNSPLSLPELDAKLVVNQLTENVVHLHVKPATMPSSSTTDRQRSTKKCQKFKTWTQVHNKKSRKNSEKQINVKIEIDDPKKIAVTNQRGKECLLVEDEKSSTDKTNSLAMAQDKQSLSQCDETPISFNVGEEVLIASGLPKALITLDSYGNKNINVHSVPKSNYLLRL